jgi:dolichol-phosphate mannosyltransferase
VLEPASRAPSEPVRLSIVLAVLNERRNLLELFGRLCAVPLPPWEALVVDDGSTDGSREWVAERARTDPRVRLLLHEGKQTTVAAQAMGIAEARGRDVVIMDSDLQHPPEVVADLLGALDRGATIAVASRYVPGGTPGPRPPLRAVISRAAEALAKLLLPAARRLSDPVSGFFAFRREAFVPLEPGTRGYKLLLFVLATARDAPIREVPFRFEPRGSGQSKLTSGSAFVRYYLVELILARRLARKVERRRLREARPSGA